MNTCESFSESFSDYVENTVHTEQRQSLDTHLSQCPSCHAAVDRLQNLRSRMRALPRLKTSPDFDTMLRTRLMLERKRAARFHFFPEFARIPRSLAYALAGVAVFLLVGVFARNGQSSHAFAPRLGNEELRISSVTTPASNTSHPLPKVYALDKISPASLLAPRASTTETQHSPTSDSLAERQTTPPGRITEASTF